MSSRVLTLVGDRFPGGGSELMTMLFLSDWCNDDGGSLYPSISFLAAKLRVTESQARRVLHKLIDAGFVSVIGNAYGGAPGATRDYHLNVEKLLDLPILPDILRHYERNKSRRNGSRASVESAQLDRARGCADATPRMYATPRMDADNGSHSCTGGLAPMRETASTHASLTTNNRQRITKEPSPTATLPTGDAYRAKLVTVDELVDQGVAREHAIDWLAVRKAKKAPLMLTAWKGVVREAGKAGITVAQAVEICAERGWIGFRADYASNNARAAPTVNRQQKFDPTNFVNRNRPTENERSTIVVDM